MKIKVLIVQFDPFISEYMAHHLSIAGYDPKVIHNGEHGLQIALTETFDIVIMESKKHNGLDGNVVLQCIRKQNNRVPVMILAQQYQKKDIAEVLEAGADDFMRIPFEMAELIARINTILKRSSYKKPSKKDTLVPLHYKVGELTIYPDKYEVETRGYSITLRPKEFEVLLYLAQNPGIAIQRKTLLDTVWGVDFSGEQRIVDVYISSIRKRLEPYINTLIIKPVRKIGYRLIILDGYKI